MMKVTCQKCREEREVKKTGELSSTYQKRRPLCVKCGQLERIKTLGGHAPNWKGGKHIDHKGYTRSWDDNQKTYIMEHRKIWEEAFGKIPEGYVIHHKDEDKQNNNIENLACLMKSTHDKYHGDHLRKNHYNQATQRTEDLLCVV